MDFEIKKPRRKKTTQPQLRQLFKIFSDFQNSSQNIELEPNYQFPKKIGDYSYKTIDKKKYYKMGNELKRVMVDANEFDKIIGKDLNEGDDGSWMEDDDDPDNLDNILRTIEKLCCPKVDVITWRGTLSKIMCMPYYQDPFVLRAYMSDGSLHIYEEQRIHGEFHKNPALHWGFSFEYFMTKNISNQQIPISEFLQNEYFCIYETKLGQNSIIFGAEMDATILENEKEEFIELKTSKLIQNKKDKHIFDRIKIPRVWSQCYLVGIQNVFYGFRDQSGILKDIQRFQINKEIQEILNKKKINRNLMMLWLEELISKLIEFFQKEVSQDLVLKITWNSPFKNLYFEVIDD